MESKRTFLAIFMSMAVLLGYQYFFAPPAQKPAEPPAIVVTEAATPAPAAAIAPVGQSAPSAPQAMSPDPARPVREIKVDTDLYAAVFSEAGGGLVSLQLKEYRESLAKDAGLKELVTMPAGVESPLVFVWDDGTTTAPFFVADREYLAVAAGQGDGEKLTMRATLASGLEVTRTIVFQGDDYRMHLEVEVYNPTATPQSGTPQMRLVSRPLSTGANTGAQFAGPAAFAAGSLQQFKVDKLLEAPQAIRGQIDWVAYEDTYFMCGILPAPPAVGTAANLVATFGVSDTDKTTIVLSGAPEIIAPNGRVTYQYTAYFGPKKIDILNDMGANLNRVVDFGWFDIIARPTLVLLNFLHGYVKNYGVAIILVTVFIKLLFWPIASKGMKSMKNMQKIQPKLTKIREKYKDDKERLNVEMMNLYKTYKINPLGGCLPMVLQIPVFFALYKVLLQAIELRHAPFMFWITDLSAPDRLFLGFDLPYLHGLPVLTLLMGGSMFLQQKMTPTSADPNQAKIMMFLPVVFTFMFLNFASGLVLYWFVNNLLAMLQQYIINKQVEA
jgi:YidC/Oxa1 family membrane protein insertase